MKMLCKKAKNNGTALILALIFSAILAIGVGGYMAFVVGQSKIVKHNANYIQALYLAEAGIDKAIVALEQYSSPPATFPGIVETGLGSGSYIVESVEATYIGDNIVYEIHSVGNVNEASREIVAEIQAETFAKWSYFTDSENYLIHWWWWVFEVPVWFTSGSYLEGPVHTNGQFNVSGYPIMNGPVSSVAGTLNYMHGPDQDGIKFYDDTCEGYNEDQDALFEPDELTLGVEEIDMSSLSADRLKTGATQAGGMDLDGDTSITLLDDGTMNVTNATEGWVQENMSIPSNGALFVNSGDLYIAGILDGELTVGSSQNVVITDNLVYESHPIDNPDTNDKMGIIAEENVIIQEKDNGVADDIEINASMIALDDSFTVENYDDPSLVEGALTVYGGIIQNTRGPVGTFYSWNNQKRSGYDKNYSYDQRMHYLPPPFFPKTGNYEMIYWKEVINESE